jgi:hypothetical protein
MHVAVHGDSFIIASSFNYSAKWPFPITDLPMLAVLSSYSGTNRGQYNRRHGYQESIDHGKRSMPPARHSIPRRRVKRKFVVNPFLCISRPAVYGTCPSFRIITFEVEERLLGERQLFEK